MPAYDKRTDVDIAAMRKQETTNYNVMLPGSGTPWEDRGRTGFIPAFLKTCFKSLFGHKALLDQIRRPETTSEATWFAVGCAAMWAVSIAIWDGLIYYRYYRGDLAPTLVVNGEQYLIETALRAAGAVVFLLIFLRVATTMFVSLLGHSTQQQIPKVLIYNVLGYSLGPSILVFVPVLDIFRLFMTPASAVPGFLLHLPLLSFALAGAWIMIDALIGAKTRLYLRAREAVVNVMLIGVVVVVLLVLLYLALYYLWPLILGGSIEPVPKPVAMPA
jgi:hypothetical protein